MDISAFLPGLGNTAFTVVAFVIALSVIVFVHEYGHYIVGRWSGIKAEVFSIGFGPRLWSRVDRRGTRWQIAAIPFGGYVKFLGDADAASAGTDEEVVRELTPEERRHTMAGAPLWARAATVAAGPIFNFIFTIVIFTGVILTDGRVAEPIRIAEMHPLPGAANGLRVGDEIIAIAGIELPKTSAGNSDINALRDELPKEPQLAYTVRRAGEVMDVPGPFPFPASVANVIPLSAAADAGLQEGDVITAVDGAPIFDFDQLKTRVEAGEGKPLRLGVWRAGQQAEFVLKPRRVDEPDGEGGFRTEWRIGIANTIFFEPARESVGFIEALKAGVMGVWRVIDLAFSGLVNLISGAISSCNMAGPLTMAQLAGHSASQGAASFIELIALISTAIGLFNLFPVPALDGGHLVFYGYEAIFRRPAPEKVHTFLMLLGLAMILSLMVFAVGNDIVCWLMRKEWMPF